MNDSNSQQPLIVLFPHPVEEFYFPSRNYHGLDSFCGWNEGSHRRRFILSRGEYVDVHGCLKSAELAFWSEWEANTLVTRLSALPTNKHEAKWLHKPQYPTPCPIMDSVDEENVGEECCMNTDPCVFGDTFKYSLCRQTRRNKNSRIATEMQNLPIGSLIVFGGTKEGGFYLDTVFVVGQKMSYVGPDSQHKIPCSNTYRILTLNQTFGQLQFYRGVTWYERDKYQGMYSFAPGKVVLDGVSASFLPLNVRERCLLDFESLNDIIRSIGVKDDFFNVECCSNFKAIRLDPKMVGKVWVELIRQMKKQQFVQCVHFDWPKPKVVSAK